MGGITTFAQDATLNVVITMFKDWSPGLESVQIREKYND